MLAAGKIALMAVAAVGTYLFVKKDPGTNGAASTLQGHICQAPNGAVIVCQDEQPHVLSALATCFITVGVNNNDPIAGPYTSVGLTRDPNAVGGLASLWLQGELRKGRIVLIAVDGRQELVSCAPGQELALCPRSPLRNAVLVEPSQPSTPYNIPSIFNGPVPGQPQSPYSLPQSIPNPLGGPPLQNPFGPPPQGQPGQQPFGPPPQGQPGQPQGQGAPAGFQMPTQFQNPFGGPPLQNPFNPPPPGQPGQPGQPPNQGQAQQPQFPRSIPNPFGGPAFQVPDVPGLNAPAQPGGPAAPSSPPGQPAPPAPFAIPGLQSTPPAGWPQGIPWPGAPGAPGQQAAPPPAPPPFSPPAPTAPFSPPPGATVYKNPSDGLWRHVIRQGDIATQLAQSYTGDFSRWKELGPPNQLTLVYQDSQPYGFNPWRLGQVLILPQGWDASKGAAPINQDAGL